MDRHCDCLDFPCSWAFYRAHCWEQHGFDPGSNIPSLQKEIIPIFRPHPIDAEIDQLKGGFLFLERKLNEHIDLSKKKKGKY